MKVKVQKIVEHMAKRIKEKEGYSDERALYIAISRCFDYGILTKKGKRYVLTKKGRKLSKKHWGEKGG